MAKVTLADILALPVEERIQLIEDAWDSLAAYPDAFPLTDAQREELDQRIDAYHHDPASGSPWEDVKGRIRRSA